MVEESERKRGVSLLQKTISRQITDHGSRHPHQSWGIYQKKQYRCLLQRVQQPEEVSATRRMGGLPEWTAVNP